MDAKRAVQLERRAILRKLKVLMERQDLPSGIRALVDVEVWLKARRWKEQ